MNDDDEEFKHNEERREPESQPQSDTTQCRKSELSQEMEDVLHDFPELLEDICDEVQTKADLKSLQREEGFPSYATFMRALVDDEFKNVKKRERHYHARCPTCTHLNTLLLRARKNMEDRSEYLKQLKDHHMEVKAWRRYEQAIFTRARSQYDCPVV